MILQASVFDRFLNNREQLLHAHSWYRDLVSQYPLHLEIRKLLVSGCEPASLLDLAMQWPHVSTVDPAQVAFTRSEEHGLADRQTRVSLGKYLRRMFPVTNLGDHEIRDIVARVKVADQEMGFFDDMERMVEVVQNGPNSCMKDDCWDFEDHPYRAYAPCFGWHMAYRRALEGASGPKYVGRAICLTRDNGDKVFVRSFKYSDTTSYSHSDEALESWLTEQGYRRLDGWPMGVRLALVYNSDGDVLTPYLDGDSTRVYPTADYLVVDDDGEWSCTETDGGHEENEPRVDCADCGSEIPESDAYHIDYRVSPNTWCERTVCEGCLVDDYVDAYSFQGATERVPESDVVEVDGYFYYTPALADNSIVELDNGEYCCESDAVQIVGGDWVRYDDPDVVSIEEFEGFSYADSGDTWVCDFSHNMYYFREKSVQVAGFTVHADFEDEAKKIYLGVAA